ncbi:DUF58 domain-containing protein [Rarobacter faecitabidus]|uniref:Uncharacterized protein (DUF58 family) n=1 Tax=Rarobacter faecitabidus TaxID=13243 RepID=A0A542Z8J2_RARFA|nr:DUF58 domain-containing protein [Rarobacter faecitabidus]TQL56667.1 uncharacterized protein (DUF58 family) [Rarobacter faecitabidus]
MSDGTNLKIRGRFTARGWFILLAGTTLVTFGVLTSLRTLLVAGTTMLLAVASAIGHQAWLRRRLRRAELRVTRTTDPPSPAWGTPTAISVRLSGRRLPRVIAWWFGTWIVDQVSAQVAGYEGTVALQFSRGGWETQYRVTPWARGAWPLGPMTLRFTDPMRLSVLRLSHPQTTTLNVRPRVSHDVSGTEADSAHTTGLITDRAPGTRRPDTDDTALREYSPGDDVRRVHWPTSARRRRLMVRAEESAPARPVAVVLDGRLVRPTGALANALGVVSQRSHRANAAAHWPVDLTASIVEALTAAGRRATLRITAASGYAEPLLADEVMDALTLLPDLSESSPPAELIGAIATLENQSVVVILAPLGDAELARLDNLVRGARSRNRTAIVVGGDDPERSELTARAFARGGWQVVAATAPDDSVLAVCHQVVAS